MLTPREKQLMLKAYELGLGNQNSTKSFDLDKKLESLAKQIGEDEQVFRSNDAGLIERIKVFLSKQNISFRQSQSGSDTLIYYPSEYHVLISGSAW